jgi:uncharacterized membrane protein (UPF0127 family)
MDDWYKKMSRLQSSAAYFLTRDVLDVEFENGEVLELYVAITQQERSSGLSNISVLDLDGMMFFYETPSFVPFTMSNMLMDLNIAWYDQAGKLIKSGQFKAEDPTPIFCPSAFSYVIETPVGELPGGNLKLRK